MVQLRRRLLQQIEHLYQAGNVKTSRQTAHGGFIKSAGHKGTTGIGRGLAHQQIPDQRGHLAYQGRHFLSAGIQTGQTLQRTGGVAVGHAVQQRGGLQISGQTKGGKDALLIHRAAAAGTLVQQGQGVAHAAVGQAGDQFGAFRRQVDPLLLRHEAQTGRDLVGADAFEGELLAAALDGGGHLMDLRSGQNKHQVGRRLLQDLQQSVECLRGKHVDLVHDVHALFHGGGGVDRLVQNGADVIHLVVGGGVQLQHVQHGAVLDAPAGRTAVAGIAVRRVLTVHRPGQQLGAGGLAGAAGTGEQIGVGQSS